MIDGDRVRTTAQQFLLVLLRAHEDGGHSSNIALVMSSGCHVRPPTRVNTYILLSGLGVVAHQAGPKDQTILSIQPRALTETVDNITSRSYCLSPRSHRSGPARVEPHVMLSRSELFHSPCYRSTNDKAILLIPPRAHGEGRRHRHPTLYRVSAAFHPGVSQGSFACQGRYSPFCFWSSSLEQVYTIMTCQRFWVKMG